jgi:putative addiction module killer protein
MVPTKVDVREYLTSSGDSPFWRLVRRSRSAGRRQDNGRRDAAWTGQSLERQSVGAGVFEYKVDFGPGYRVYFGKDGETIVILLAGGTKKRQQRDIGDAHARWHDYKDRKKGKD